MFDKLMTAIEESSGSVIGFTADLGMEHIAKK
jgi:hypothetical protein